MSNLWAVIRVASVRTARQVEEEELIAQLAAEEELAVPWEGPVAVLDPRALVEASEAVEQNLSTYLAPRSHSVWT